jgi:hypothetical protein
MPPRGVRKARIPRARRQVEVEQEGRDRGAGEAPADREGALGAVQNRRRLRPRLRRAMTAETTIEAMTR